MDKVEAIEMMRAELIKMVNERCDALIQVIQKGECEKIPDLNVLEYGLAWSTPSILKGKKPLAVKFRDGDRIETNTWKKVAQTILEDCNSNQDMHERLMQLRGIITGKQRIILGKDSGVMDVPLKIDEELYFEAKFDTESLLNVLVQKILEPVGYDYNRAIIEYKN